MEKQRYLSPHIKVAEIEPSSFMDWISLKTHTTQEKPQSGEITINAKGSQTSDFTQDDTGWDDN